MNLPWTYKRNLYPAALEVIRKIVNIAENENCIFRGEASIYVDFPCSSSLYRQLKKENTPEKDIPKCLKQRQKELIKDVRKYKTSGDNDFEKLMFFQHHGVKTNLLDFSRDYLFALFFACSNEPDKDGRVIIKRSGEFEILDTEKGALSTLPDDRVVMLEPHENLQRARDQHGIFLHAPEGRIPLEAGETILIRSKYKGEISDLLLKMHDKSDKTIFNDVYGEIDRQNREDEKRVQEISRPRIGSHGLFRPDNYLEFWDSNKEEQHDELLHSFTELRILANFMNNPEISVMKYYWELLRSNTKGRHNEFLKRYADELIYKFTNILKDSPNDFESYYNRAFVYFSKTGPDYDRAIEDYNYVIKLSPNLTTVHINRGNVYSRNPNPDYEQAIKDYTSELELNPDDALAYYNRGTAQLVRQDPDYKQAILDYTRALELNPDYMDAYINRGGVHTRKPNPDYHRAISDYSYAIGLNPEDAKIYYNRGIAYHKRSLKYTGRLDQEKKQAALDCDSAISDFTCAIKLDPDFAEAYVNRGNVYLRNPNPDYNQAISDYNRAIEMKPDDAKAYCNRGSAYAEKSPPDYDQAIRDHTRALDLNPDLATAYYNRGNAHKNRPEPDYDKAIEDYTCAIGLDPNFAPAYNNRGIVYREKPNPDYDKAISDYHSAIGLIPHYAQAYFNLGVIHTMGTDPDYEKAVANFSEAVKINPDYVWAYFLRATAYAELGDCARACDDYDKVIKKAPELLKELPLTPKLRKCLGSSNEGVNQK